MGRDLKDLLSYYLGSQELKNSIKYVGYAVALGISLLVVVLPMLALSNFPDNRLKQRNSNFQKELSITQECRSKIASLASNSLRYNTKYIDSVCGIIPTLENYNNSEFQ